MTSFLTLQNEKNLVWQKLSTVIKWQHNPDLLNTFLKYFKLSNYRIDKVHSTVDYNPQLNQYLRYMSPGIFDKHSQKISYTIGEFTFKQLCDQLEQCMRQNSLEVSQDLSLETRNSLAIEVQSIVQSDPYPHHLDVDQACKVFQKIGEVNQVFVGTASVNWAIHNLDKLFLKMSIQSQDINELILEMAKVLSCDSSALDTPEALYDQIKGTVRNQEMAHIISDKLLKQASGVQLLITQSFTYQSHVKSKLKKFQKSYCQTKLRELERLGVYMVNCLVFVKLGCKLAIFTQQDLKQIRTCFLSQSQYLQYASTYHTLESQITPLVDDKELLPEDFKDLQEILETKENLVQLNQNFTTDKSITRVAIDLYDFWVASTELFLMYNLSDYCGNFFHELTSLVTASHTTDFSQNQYRKTYQQIVEHWQKLSLDCVEDLIEEFLFLAKQLPLTEQMEFLKLDKYTWTFDVFPAAVFLQTANKMKKNPRTYRGELIPDEPHDFLDQQFQDSLNALCMSGNAQCRVEKILELDPQAADYIVNKSRYMNFFDIPVQVRTRYFKRPLEEVPDYLMLAVRSALFYNFLPLDGRVSALFKPAPDRNFVIPDDTSYDHLKDSAQAPEDLVDAFRRPKYAASSSFQKSWAKGFKETLGRNLLTGALESIDKQNSSALLGALQSSSYHLTGVKYESHKSPEKCRMFFIATNKFKRLQSISEVNIAGMASMIHGVYVGKSQEDIIDNISNFHDQNKQSTIQLSVSLDLSSFSNGMSKQVQILANQVISESFCGGEVIKDAQRVIDKSDILYSGSSGRFCMNNSQYANLEGYDGRRNTLIHLSLWLIARQKMQQKLTSEDFVDIAIKPFIYIDDGFMLVRANRKGDVEQAQQLLYTITKETLMEVYNNYGFDLSLLKTFFCSHYGQFLNETYVDKCHVKHGLRCLSRMAAEGFENSICFAEEVEKLVASCRAAIQKGAEPIKAISIFLRMLAAWSKGLIGSYGYISRNLNPKQLAYKLFFPKILGGQRFCTLKSLCMNIGGNNYQEDLYHALVLGRPKQSEFLGINRKEVIYTIRKSFTAIVRVKVSDVNGDLNCAKAKCRNLTTKNSLYQLICKTLIKTTRNNVIKEKLREYIELVAEEENVIYAVSQEQADKVNRFMDSSNHQSFQDQLAALCDIRREATTSQATNIADYIQALMIGKRFPIALLELANSIHRKKLLENFVDKFATSIRCTQQYARRELKVWKRNAMGQDKRAINTSCLDLNINQTVSAKGYFANYEFLK